MISKKPWQLDAVGRLLLGILCLVCFGSLLNIIVGGLKLGFDTRTLALANMLAVQGLILIGIHFSLKEQGMTWNEGFGFLACSKIRAARHGLVLALLALPLAWGLQTLSAVLLKRIGLDAAAQAVVQELSSPDLPMAQRVIYGIMSVVTAPVVEECVFRGVLYTAVKQMGHPRLALWGTAILFGASHFNIAALAPLTFFGLAQVLLYEETGSLLAPIVAHSVFNTVNFLILLFMDPISHVLNLK